VFNFSDIRYIVIQDSSINAAMRSNDDIAHEKNAFPGGIDLNTSNGMQWKINKEGRGVEMNVDPSMIERVRREGISSLSPVIIRITPLTSVWSLIGLAQLGVPGK